MVHCCVPQCTSDTAKRQENVTFHSFPAECCLREKWRQAISRQGDRGGSLWVPKNSSRVCSLHFNTSDFSVSTSNKRILPNRVPSVFSVYLVHKQKSVKCRKYPTPRNDVLPSLISDSENDEHVISSANNSSTPTTHAKGVKVSFLHKGKESNMADDMLAAIKVEPLPVLADENVEEAGTSIVKQECEFKDEVGDCDEGCDNSGGSSHEFKSMEEPVFVKCEPAWPSDTEEEPSNFEQTAALPSGSQVTIKQEPHAVAVDLNLEEDQMKDARDEERDSRDSSRKIKNTTALRGGTVLSCDVCCKTFSQTSNLKRHILTHTGVRPFSCSICSSTFSQLSHLKTHALIHKPEKSFKCLICGHAFRRLSHLKYHENYNKCSIAHKSA